ncbi:KTSC domain-containing protein [Novosphingobium sp. G106]|uniref:KTSC domain-containing protein n=1 Tax=Novosphingobium sp. G106 TaxID=2849500 RepID=UPI001C2CDAA0|nr:KTSC domain-containing protein [Novosphingobium sp. G106]MBV1690459.1 KTSC domain-containing protein [Novosphingobium sp. G106]
MPSTVIRSFAYDHASAALEVLFQNGRSYRYFMVPARVVEELSEAISKGRYFNARIRDRYPFEELADQAEAPAAPVVADKLTSPGKGSRRRP